MILYILIQASEYSDRLIINSFKYLISFRIC